jgi:hypothetical protein
MREIMADFVRYHANESLHPDVINPDGMYADGAHHSEPIEGQYDGTNATFTATRNPQEAAAEILTRRQERAHGIGRIEGRPAKPLTVDQKIQHELENNWMRHVYKHVSQHVRDNFDIERLTPELLETHLGESYEDPNSPISHESLMEMFGHHPILFHMGQSQKFRHIDDSVKDFAQYGQLYDEIYGPQGSVGGPIYEEMRGPLKAEIRANTRDYHARQRGIETRRVAPDPGIWGEGRFDPDDGMPPPPLRNSEAQTRTAPSVRGQGSAPRRPDPSTIPAPRGANNSRNAVQAAIDAYDRGVLTEDQLAALLDRLGLERSLSFAMKNADLIIKAPRGRGEGPIRVGNGDWIDPQGRGQDSAPPPYREAQTRTAPRGRGEGPIRVGNGDWIDPLEDGMPPPPYREAQTRTAPRGANTSRNAVQAAIDAHERGALTDDQLANFLDRLGLQRSLSFAMKNADLIIKAFNGYDTGDPWNSASTQTSFADNMSQEQNYDQALWNIANNQIPALFQRFSDKVSDKIDNYESSSVKTNDISSAAPAKPKRDKSSKGNQRAQPGGGLGSLGSPLPPTPPRVSSR